MLFYSTRLLVLYALFATVAWATNVPRLVPSRRADFLVSRGLDHVIPKQHALLSYSSAPHHSPAATVAFVAYPNRPILLLEDIDYFVEDIVCSSIPPDTNILTVRFADEDAFEAAAENWSQLDEFIILTAHYGCNPYTHRGSWR
ncbi:hypothetical protein BDY19DRAFT_371270 [Irpex rosettiformis]|uniref:Uncharacterized protein n=1 Tax=Irpex rosettiformis TaxID=378272 RepID=A0ACB8TW66_9APHY|nr:hypothetical protein BDY19DRAFT_371270 [Irpex rosettiformis]